MGDQIQKGFTEVNGTRLYYEVAGEGHPLVLNHGGLVDNHLWDDQFDKFAKHFKVIRYDIRGFGDSGMIKKGMEPYSMERDLFSLLQFLIFRKQNSLACSWVAASALDFTRHYLEVIVARFTLGSAWVGWEGMDL